jgi:hypothetical protein
MVANQKPVAFRLPGLARSSALDSQYSPLFAGVCDVVITPGAGVGVVVIIGDVGDDGAPDVVTVAPGGVSVVFTSQGAVMSGFGLTR